MYSHGTAAACGLCLLVTLVGRGYADEPRVDANPYTSRARDEMAALQYHAAQDLLTRALEHGSSNPTQLAELYRMAAEVAAGLDQNDRARALFEKLLALRPGSSLPEGTSPKISRPFVAAQATMSARQPLRARYQVRDGPTPKIVLVIVSDPLAMVAGGRARFRDQSGRESRAQNPGSKRIEIALPAGKPLDVVVAALDEYGNELAVHGSWEVPIRVPTPHPALPRGPLPIYERWYLWGGVSAALATTGLLFGVAMDNADEELDELHARTASEPISYDDARTIEKRGRRYALMANVSYVAAGMAGAVGTFLLTRELVRSRKGSPRTTVGPSADGLGVQVRVSF